MKTTTHLQTHTLPQLSGVLFAIHMPVVSVKIIPLLLNIDGCGEERWLGMERNSPNQTKLCFSVTCSYVCVYIFTVLVYFPKYCSWNCVSVGYIESHDILMYIWRRIKRTMVRPTCTTHTQFRFSKLKVFTEGSLGTQKINWRGNQHTKGWVEARWGLKHRVWWPFLVRSVSYSPRHIKQ